MPGENPQESGSPSGGLSRSRRAQILLCVASVLAVMLLATWLIRRLPAAPYKIGASPSPTSRLGFTVPVDSLALYYKVNWK